MVKNIIKELYCFNAVILQSHCVCSVECYSSIHKKLALVEFHCDHQDKRYECEPLHGPIESQKKRIK